MIRAVVGAAVTAVVLAACAQTSQAGTSRASGSKQDSPGAPLLVPSSGGAVTVDLDQVPTTLNDHTVAGDNASTRYVTSAIWPQMFEVGPNQTPMADTDFVQSAELVNLNPQTVVYQINPKAKWSDGVPIDVSDFVYAWTSQRGGATDIDGTPDSVASVIGYRDISSVTGSNNGRTVTVVFRTPFGDWPSLFNDLLPAHVAENVGWNNGFNTLTPGFVSAGPWKVASWQPGQRIVLVRNPHWWGRQPYLDQVIVQAAPSSADLVQQLTSGSAQVGYPSAFDETTLAALSAAPRLQTSQSLGDTMLQLFFNTREAPLDSALVRQGIAHEVDRSGIVTNLVQAINPSIWIDGDHLFANAQAPYSQNDSAYQGADPATAARLLEQGGLSQQPNVTWQFRHTPVMLRLAFADDDPWSTLVEPAIVSELVNAGFAVEPIAVTSAQLESSVLPGGDFDLALAPVPATNYPSSTLPYFTSAPNLANTGADVNWSGLDDPTLDSLLTQASQQLGTNLATPLYNQADQELWNQMPSLPLFAEPTLLASSASLTGVQDDPGALGPMYSLDMWQLLAPQRSKATG